MLTQKTAINRVTNFAREIKGTGINLRRVILYGSYANNKQHKWSDIDVALVADEFSGVSFMDLDYFGRISIKKPYILIETQTYPTAYFKKGDPFMMKLKEPELRLK